MAGGNKSNSPKAKKKKAQEKAVNAQAALNKKNAWRNR